MILSLLLPGLSPVMLLQRVVGAGGLLAAKRRRADSIGCLSQRGARAGICASANCIGRRRLQAKVLILPQFPADLRPASIAAALQKRLNALESVAGGGKRMSGRTDAAA